MGRFNREIASVRWPPGLTSLEFCGELQQRVEDVALPQTLTHLALLGDFDQPIHAVRWPAGLTTVRFGDRFRQPVAAAAWPPSLRVLALGRGYDMSLLRAGCSGGGAGGGGSGSSWDADEAGSFSSTGTEEPEVLGERRRQDLPPFLRSPADGDCCGRHGEARDCIGAAGLPSTCEVLRACDGEGGGDVGDGGCAAVAVAPQEEEEQQEQEGEADVQAEGRQHPAAEEGVAEGDALIAGCEALYLDGDSVGGGDGRYSAWNADEDEEGGGLECEDVFGFEDGTWDMGDPWDPGSYPSGCGSVGSGCGSSTSGGSSSSGMSY